MTDYKIEYPLGFQEFEHALREVKGFPVERLPSTCELWVDYRLENGRNIAEKLFIDHKRRRLTPQAPRQRSGSLYDDGTWKDEDIDIRERECRYFKDEMVFSHLGMALFQNSSLNKPIGTTSSNILAM